MGACSAPLLSCMEGAERAGGGILYSSAIFTVSFGNKVKRVLCNDVIFFFPKENSKLSDWCHIFLNKPTLQQGLQFDKAGSAPAQLTPELPTSLTDTLGKVGEREGEDRGYASTRNAE